MDTLRKMLMKTFFFKDMLKRRLVREELAQGTTEYAILVGVLVVIAILAIIAFRDKVSSLWDQISSGINSL